MSESNTDNADLEVLLSGYLDGELSAEETTRVEAALQESADLRKQLEQMRCMDEAFADGEPPVPSAEQ